ncbi:hypothetical protein FHT32_001289 [Variovorax sp. SG517]|uniref:hypothetical protein n=1 Tax=Variovorax sp. SG517 TaxID=2587117 RepID=UPI00159DAB53|nr:hypothetical protein [Variovorax sp. SG517]NVM87650.1 hypothetical protein [Variovorax sp. SG517]
MFKRPPPYKPQNGLTLRQDALLFWLSAINGVFWLAVLATGGYFLPFDIGMYIALPALGLCALCAFAIEKFVAALPSKPADASSSSLNS